MTRRALGRASLVGLACLLAALFAARAGQGAGQPRFLLSIEGTQRFDWTIAGGRDARGQPTPCAFKGSGHQSIAFRTARPVPVLVPPGQGLHGTYGGDAFLVAATRKRLVPLVGRESREYRVVEPPDRHACPGFEAQYDGYGSDCSGTNAFLPNASVVVLRYNPTRFNPKRLSPQRTMMYVPVDVLLFPRRPRDCNLLLFDLRNSLLAQLVTLGHYLPLKGGRFEQRGTKTVRATGSVRACVDPFGSSEANADFQSCDRPKRPGALTGEIRADWTMTFVRAR